MNLFSSILDFAVPEILLLMSIIMYLFPSKKINYFYGYKTTKSTLNQECWDFSQRFYSLHSLWVNFLLTLTHIVLILKNVFNYQLVFGVISILLTFLIILITEYKLKKLIDSKDMLIQNIDI